METTDSLAPLAATVLNVSADHLDRHGTLELYAELKEKLLEGGRARRRQRRRSARRRDGRAARARRAVLRADGARARLFDRRARTASAGSPATASRCCAPRSSKLRGTHNEANALAALALTAPLTTDLDAALDALRTFPGLPHRCQHVSGAQGRHVRRRLERHERRRHARGAERARGPARADCGRLEQGPGLVAARRRRARQAASRRADRRGRGRARARARADLRDGACEEHGRCRRSRSQRSRDAATPCCCRPRARARTCSATIASAASSSRAPRGSCRVSAVVKPNAVAFDARADLRRRRA